MIEEKCENEKVKVLTIPSSFKAKTMQKAEIIPTNKNIIYRNRCCTIVKSGKKTTPNKMNFNELIKSKEIEEQTPIRRNSFIKLDQKSSTISNQTPVNPETSSDKDHSEFSTEEIVIQTLEEDIDDSLLDFLIKQ